MKQFKDFKLFKKVIRKYWKKYAVKTHFYSNGKKYTTYWTNNSWCYFLINDPNLLDNPNIIKRFMFDMTYEDYMQIKDKWKSLLGKEVIALNSYNMHKCSGILNSLVLTNNGAYFGFTNFIDYDGKEYLKDMLQIVPFVYDLQEK